MAHSHQDSFASSEPLFYNMTAQETIPVTNGNMPGKGAHDSGQPNGHNPSIEVDALVVGAGFSGITAIHRLQKAGLTVKCMEASSGFRGVWNFHRYESFSCRIYIYNKLTMLKIPWRLCRQRSALLSAQHTRSVSGLDILGALSGTRRATKVHCSR